jgi:membrane protease subunit HflK
MPWSNQSGGPWGSGPQGPPDLEYSCAAARTGCADSCQAISGAAASRCSLAVIALWCFSGFFRVEPDELGVVLRFVKFAREVPPGLNYHLPYPIESALAPQALRVNKIDIGFDLRRGSTMSSIPQESLMLTGDENIVDVDFSVLWKVKAVYW